ncbi:uncharacterized protein [Palaemon carinicauda]|uniref:uncharacterized protein n=1 Tax=Palaemon carinicauda TaxID=392227 RepID=UPI0035B671F4
MAKGFIFLFLLTTLPNLLPAQNIEDDVSIVPLSVTEIRRVNTVSEDSETKDAKIYATQVTIEDCTLPKGYYTFKLSFIGSDGTSTSGVKNVSLETEGGTVPITFDMIIPDNATTQILTAMIGKSTEGIWRGNFIINDIKARVAVIDRKYLRVTTGELEKVTIHGRTEMICDNTTSPCYYSRDEFEDFPPVTDRCVNLPSNGIDLKYCDDTVTESIALSDEPSLILLDEEVLNLRYPTTNNTYEVLMIEKDSLLKKENIFKCSNYETPNIGCNVKISILGTEVTFIITTVDENDFVEGSSTDIFNVIPVEVIQLTEDSVFASWKTDLDPPFDVFIKTKSNLDEFEYRLNATCTSPTENRFESLFINVKKDKNHIAVVQQGNNAVAKTIKGGVTPLDIYRIYKTEGISYDLTFMVQTATKNLPTVELIEVNVLEDHVVENQYYNGTVNKTSDGYWFKTSEVTGTLSNERKFYLVEYKESNIPVSCGVTYITFVDVEVELRVVGLNNSIVRTHVFGNKNVTVGNEACDATCTCYTEENEGVDLITICTKIENSAPSGGHLDQCEEMKVSSPSVLEDDPHLLLLDSFDLYLRYDTKTAFEVLALDMEGHIISGNPDFTCAVNKGGCYMKDILPKDSLVVGFTIISVSENGSLSESKDYLFENVHLGAWYLTDDAVITKWTSVYEGMSASIRIWSDPDHNKYSSDVICDSATPCEYFFILPENSDYVAVISSGTNSVAKTITKDLVVESGVKKISKTADPDVTVFSVERKEKEASSQFDVKLIEVSESGETVTNILHEGTITEQSSTLYEYSTSDDIMKIDGEKKFLLVEYSDKQITGVGPVYVTFEGK